MSTDNSASGHSAILSDDQIAEVWKQREPDHYPSGAVKIDAITRNDNLRTLIDSHRALQARLRELEGK